MSLHDQILDFTLPENVEESEVDTTAVASEATLPPLPKPSKRKPRSNMWDHFDKQPGDEMYAKCHYCGDLIKYKSGTSSMRNHLARCKESPINTSNKRQRQAMSNATEGQVASSPSYSKFDQAACRLQLAKTIVSAELPFRFVENEEFQKFLNLMLRSALKYQNAFSLLQLRDKSFKHDMEKKNKGLLVKEDWDHARAVVPFLEMFMVSTKNMSGTSYVTSNLYMKEVFGIGTKIRKYLESSNESIKKMAKSMKTKFDKYWGDPQSMNILLWIALVLDPRMKYSFVEYHIGILCVDATKATELKLKVMTSLKVMYAQYQGIELSSQPESQPDDDDEDDPMYLYLKTTGRSRTDPQSEIDKYLKEEAEAYNKNVSFDILGWWKVNSVRFPILATIAREVLAIPVSTVASECAFSTGGRVLGDHRCCLKHTMLEGLVCLQDWLKGQPHYLFNDEDPEEILRFDQEISSQDCGVNLDD